MVKVNPYFNLSASNIVLSVSRHSVMYNQLNNENGNKLDLLNANESLITNDNKKIYLVDKDFKKAASFINNIKGDTCIDMDSFISDDISILDLSFNISRDLVVASYNFDELKSIKKEVEDKNYFLTTAMMIDFQVPSKRGVIVGESICESKRLVDLPLSHLNSEDLANYCLSLANNNKKLKVKVLDKSAIEKLNMNSFLSVNKGSSVEPKLIELEFFNNPNSKEFIQLIGKGLTFDTGGYSLKGNMINMKSDMGGASCVISTINALARLDSCVNVKVLVLATDNKVSPDAIVPDDVVTSMSGKTIEIVSTDAEGRLTLCDAITYSCEVNKATKIIDIATLTGSAVATFGSLYSACYTNDNDFLNPLMDVCEKNNENLWQLPLNDKYFDSIKSTTADMKNSNSNRLAGASVAAIFLKQFVPSDVSWIHLDIAGTTLDNKSCATGILVNSLVEYLSN